MGTEATSRRAVCRQYIDKLFCLFFACLHEKVRRDLAWWGWIADVREVLDCLRQGAEKYRPSSVVVRLGQVHTRRAVSV